MLFLTLIYQKKRGHAGIISKTITLKFFKHFKSIYLEDILNLGF